MNIKQWWEQNKWYMKRREAKKNSLTDANKRFDVMLMWIHDRIYVGIWQNTKEVWIGRSDRVWTGSEGFRWKSDESLVVCITESTNIYFDLILSKNLIISYQGSNQILSYHGRIIEHVHNTLQVFLTDETLRITEDQWGSWSHIKYMWKQDSIQMDTARNMVGGWQTYEKHAEQVQNMDGIWMTYTLHTITHVTEH